MKPTILPLISLAILSCTPTLPPLSGQTPLANIATSQSNLSAAQRSAIGRKIWQNESGGTINGLTAWNNGENFPSLGIGHFIWYPSGQRGPFTESFPEFIQFARQRGATPPAIALTPACPWPTQTSFKKAFNGPQLSSLRHWLAGTIELQTDFLINRTRASLPKILQAAGPDAARVQANYDRVAASPQGQYALIDYVNFKGEGISASERYNGQGWGLLQVLQGMGNAPAGPAAAIEFSASAKRVLTNRVRNAPASRGESRWLAGWHNRCDTYARPL